MSEPSNAEGHEVLCFCAAGEELAVPIGKVREIVEAGAMTWLPGVATVIRGALNLRTKAVPVVDLAMRFGLPATALDKRTCVVVIETEARSESLVVGLLADSVTRVLAIPAEKLQPPPKLGTKPGAAFVRSMAVSADKFILVLDVDAVLDGIELEDAPATVDLPQAGAPMLEATPPA